MSFSTKKRKEPPSVTLHDFFAPKIPAKRVSGVRPSHASSKAKKEQAALRSTEVISIDSDSDEEISQPNKKYKSHKVSDQNNSHGQFVDPLPEKKHRSHPSSKSATDNVSPDTPNSLTRVSAVLSKEGGGLLSLPSAESSVPISFGQPSNLLRDRSLEPLEKTSSSNTSFTSCVTSSLQYQRTTSDQLSEELSFGAPAVLLSSQSNTADINQVPPKPGSWNENADNSSVRGGSDSRDSSPNAPFMDDTKMQFNKSWDVRLDKMVAESIYGYHVQIEEVNCASRVANSIACPVCAQCFSAAQVDKIQNHVNRCIDHVPSPPLIPDDSPSSSKLVLDQKTSALPLKDNVFNFLMSSHRENEVWTEAAVADARVSEHTQVSASRRKAPFYKVLQGMPIAVDAFRYGDIPGVTAYFLTHAHSDHYTNLSHSWKNGPIYCSDVTAKLIIHMLSIDPRWVHPLPMDEPTIIPNTGGVSVTLIEANHCPGSCLFLFEGLQTVDAGDSAYKSPFVGSSKTFRYLHCGDFRASPRHVLHPSVKNKRMDHVYLDTTYLDPKYTFPPQSLVISACAELVQKISFQSSSGTFRSQGNGTSTMDDWVTQIKPESTQRFKEGGVLVVVGTYSIGKERIVKGKSCSSSPAYLLTGCHSAIARVLRTKIYCDARKAAILRCQNDSELHAMLTSDPIEGKVHLLPLGMVVSDKLKIYLERFKGTYCRVVGFRPTGWTYTAPSGSNPCPPISTVISASQHRPFTSSNLKPMQKSSHVIQLYGVPYSEHSSFFELTCFALSLDWAKIIATVNVGSESSRAKINKWVQHWEVEKKKRPLDSIVEYRGLDYW